MSYRKAPLCHFQLNRLVKEILVFSITVLFLSSCNSLQLQQKGDASVETVTDARSAIQDQEPQYKWMNARVKLSAKTPSRSLNGQGHLKIKKDSLLWLTVSPALGIEVMRLQITRDSFQVLDRVNNRYRHFSFDRVNQMFNPLKRAFQFKNLINIFTGQPVFLPGEHFEMTRADTSGVVMNHENNVYKERLNLFPALLKTHRYKLEKPATGQFLKLTYPAYQAVGQYQLPKVIKIKTKNPKPLALTIRLKSISFEEKDKVSFSVPESYE
jgi:hypothetical protein